MLRHFLNSRPLIQISRPCLLQKKFQVPCSRVSGCFRLYSSQLLIPDTVPLRYTAFDKQGKVVASDAKISRVDLIKKYSLHTRDLRYIDGQNALVPRILVYKGRILVSLLDMRVLIEKDSVLVFESKDPAVAERLGMLIYDFQNKLLARTTTVPYEQVALETVLIHAIAFMEIQLTKIVSNVDKILLALENHVNRNMLKELLVHAQTLNKFYLRALAVRNALETAIDDKDDMENMYLSQKLTSETHIEDDVDMELLLETYYKQADELVQQAGKTARDVSTTEDIVTMMVDANRNELMLYRLQITIVSVSFALSLYIADLYGMNLENWIEDTHWGMPVVVAVIIVVNCVGTLVNFRKLKSIKQISMAGITNAGVVRSSKALMTRWLKGKVR